MITYKVKVCVDDEEFKELELPRIPVENDILKWNDGEAFRVKGVVFFFDTHSNKCDVVYCYVEKLE